MKMLNRNVALAVLTGGLLVAGADAVQAAPTLYVTAGTDIQKIVDVAGAGQVSTFYDDTQQLLFLATDGTSTLYARNNNSGGINRYKLDDATRDTPYNGLNSPNTSAYRGGNLYVTYSTTAISKYDAVAGGSPTTFSSTGVSSSTGMVFDASGNLYVLGSNSGPLVKYDSAGTATTITITGTALSGARGLAIDSNGDLYTVNTYSGANILKIDPDTGVGTQYALSGGHGDSARQLAFDADDNLYVATGSYVSKYAFDTGTNKFVGADYATGFSGDVNGLVVVVPEPTSIALLGLGGLALLRRRRANVRA